MALRTKKKQDIFEDAVGVGNSIPATLLRIKQDLASCTISLGRLVGIQDIMQQIGAGNPYRIASVSIENASTDKGYVNALHNAIKCREPFGRLKAYLGMLKEIVKTITGLADRSVKLEARAGANGNTDAENETARALQVRCQDAINALSHKRDYVLKAMFAARKTILKSLVRLDEELRSMWPGGSPELRKAVLNANCSEEIQALALDEEMMKSTRGKRI